MFNDTIKVTILPDGSLKIETDEIGAANHTNAEGLIIEMIARMGGAVDRTEKAHGQYWSTEGMQIKSSS